jgi:uncharacterized protein (DUF433 family)
LVQPIFISVRAVFALLSYKSSSEMSETVATIVFKPKQRNKFDKGRIRMHERISINPKFCHGQACIRGTRIPVHQILRMLANGDNVGDLLEDYPSLKADDIFACLEYAASLAEEQVSPIETAI